MNKTYPRFKIDYWYHFFVLFGAVGTITTLIFDFKGINNFQALLLFLGIFFIGIGEWINHPLQTGFVPPNISLKFGGIFEEHPRNPNLQGSLFDILGFILIVTAIYKIAYTA